MSVKDEVGWDELGWQRIGRLQWNAQRRGKKLQTATMAARGMVTNQPITIFLRAGRGGEGCGGVRQGGRAWGGAVEGGARGVQGELLEWGGIVSVGRDC